MTNVRRRDYGSVPTEALTRPACWDTPPPVDSTLYPAFKHALGRYLNARQVTIPILTPAQIKQREIDAARQREPPQTQPDCVVGGVSYWYLSEHSR